MTPSSASRPAVTATGESLQAHGPDATTFRNVMGRYPTGVTLVAGLDEQGEPLGMVVGTLTSVSLDPPLVAFLPSKTSSSWAKMRHLRRVCINVLAADQEALCRTFASKAVEDKWAGVAWHPAPSGAPVIEGSVAWIDCEIEEVLERGDHYIVLTRVEGMAAARSVSPLTFVRGGYGRFSIDSLVAEEQPGLMDQLRIAQLARGLMEHLAQETGYESTIQASVGDELVILAAAGGDDPDWAGENHVGIRLPFIPPFGGIFMAWSSTEAVHEWIERRWAPSTDQRDQQVAALQDIRDAGYVVVTPIDPQVDAVLDKVFDGDAPEPEEIQQLRDRIQALDPYYVTQFSDDEELTVRYLGAPVFDRRGRVVVVLRLIVGEVLSGAQTRPLVRRLVESADAITALIGGVRPETDQDVAELKGDGQ